MNEEIEKIISEQVSKTCSKKPEFSLKNAEIAKQLLLFDNQKREEYNEILGVNHFKDVLVCGVDEVGRGPLAGEVFASAVILPFGSCIAGVNDSKKLSENAREFLSTQILSEQIALGVASSSVAEIEELNILNAAMLAMERAVKICLDKVQGGEGRKIIVLVDGNKIPKFPQSILALSVVRGDATSYAISCASIVAKVVRDGFMQKEHLKYPEFNFSSNKGYGTSEHISALKNYGVTKIHRKSFLKKILTDSEFKEYTEKNL